MARKKFGLTLEPRDGAATTAPEPLNTENKIAEINSPTSDPFGYKLVPFHKIKRNEKNDYEMVNLTSLKESILKGELLHNFDVKYELETDCYVLISGERRFTSLEILREEFENIDPNTVDPERLQLYKKNVEPFFTMGVPCKILNRNKDLDEIDELILLNEANLEVRELSPAKKAAKIAELQELYKKRNERDGKDDSVQEQVADTLQISKRQVQQYTAINEKLIPELKEEFDNNNLTVKEGSTFAQLDEEGQKNILNIIKKQGKIDNGDLLALKEEQAIREKRIADLEKELEEKSSQLTIAEEKATNIIEKNNELILSLNQTREDFAKKEESLRQNLEEEIKSDNQEHLNELQKELAKVQDEKKLLEKHISDIEQHNKLKENELQQLREKLEEQRQIADEKPETVLTENEKLLLKYNYELAKTVDEIKALLTKAEKTISETQKLDAESVLPADISANINYITKLLESTNK